MYTVDPRNWWHDITHPLYDGNVHEINQWWRWTVYQQQPSPATEQQILDTAVSASSFLGGFVGGVLQWSYTRGIACAKPNAMVAALAAVPTALIGMCLWSSLMQPLVLEHEARLARSMAAVKAEDDEYLYAWQAYHVYKGTRPWPLPLRPATDTAVPNWVDRPPPDFHSEWSAGRMEWKRRVAEEWCYTADDVAVRSRVLNARSWCYQLPQWAGCALYGSAAWALQRRRPPANRMLFGLVATKTLLPFLGGWFGLKLGPKLYCWYSDCQVRQLDPVSSAYRRGALAQLTNRLA